MFCTSWFYPSYDWLYCTHTPSHSAQSSVESPQVNLVADTRKNYCVRLHSHHSETKIVSDECNDLI